MEAKKIVSLQQISVLTEQNDFPLIHTNWPYKCNRMVQRTCRGFTRLISCVQNSWPWFTVCGWMGESIQTHGMFVQGMRLC